MKIIPVMDLLNEQVVHGIAGKRKEYKPIANSVVTESAEPIQVAQDFYEKLKVEYCYIADLDLIQQTDNSEVNKKIIHKLTQTSPLKFMIDGGCKSIADVKELLDLGADFVIIGTETLNSLDDLKEIVEKVGGERIILSIDLIKGVLLSTNSPKLQRVSFEELIDFVDKLNLYAIIVLDLAKVGSQKGPISESLLGILGLSPITNIFAGGGVRNSTDLMELKSNGISGCLIATAIHKGSITRDDIQQISKD